jgi:hypothetical protein
MGCVMILVAIASCFAWFQVSMIGFVINIIVSLVGIVVSTALGVQMQASSISQEEAAGGGCWLILMGIANLVGIVWWAVRYYGG